MMKNTHSYNRPRIFNRQFLIQKRFQKQFMVSYLIAVLLIVSTLIAALYLRIESAVENHLYRTHIHIEKVGDFLIDLLFQANFYAISAIVLVVIVLSLTLFHKINSKFDRLGEAVETMGRGETFTFTGGDRSWSEVGNLSALLSDIQKVNDERFLALNNALDILEAGCTGSADNIQQLEKGKEDLDKVIQSISFV